jgi:predicted phosphodiesterase
MKILNLTDTHYSSELYNKETEFFNRIKENESFDIIVHCGDIASIQEWFEEYLYLLSTSFRKTPIYIVYGNHDIWFSNSSFFNLQERHDILTNICKKFSVNYLPSTPYIDKKNKILVTGIDGWYIDKNVKTNDSTYLPQEISYDATFHALRNRSYEQMLNAINVMSQYSDYKKVFASHFNFFQQKEFNDYWGDNQKYLDFLPDNSVYLFGHSHEQFDEVKERNIRCINVGSKYNLEKYKVIEV